MKAYKFEVVCFDLNGDCDVNSMFFHLQNQRYFSSQVVSVQSTEIGEWDDDHPLNQHSESKQYIQNCIWDSEEV